MEIELGEIQEQFAQIIWEHEPIALGLRQKNWVGKNRPPILF